MPIDQRLFRLVHDTSLAQRRDFLGRISAACEDLIAMLAKGWSRGWRRFRVCQ
jgi:hypothetical protein